VHEQPVRGEVHLRRHVDQREQMLDVAVHVTVAAQAQQVDVAVRFIRVLERVAAVRSSRRNDPPRIELLIRLISWSTMRPAPMFWCPTSELPIVFGGRPTSSPLVRISVVGHSLVEPIGHRRLRQLDRVERVVLRVRVLAPAVTD
jgi:hypothetical protein